MNSSTLQSNYWYCVRIGEAQLALTADHVVDVCPSEFSPTDEMAVDFIVLDGEVIFIAPAQMLLHTSLTLESREAANTVLILKMGGVRVGLRVNQYIAAVHADPLEQTIQAHGQVWEVVAIKDAIS